MSRKLALPLFLLAFALCVIFASRTPQPIIEELTPEEAEAPAVLLTKTEEVGGQTVTLRVYELDEDGYARYALFRADGTEIDIPFGVDRGTWIGNGDAAEKVSLTAWDDVLGFPGFEVTTVNDASHLQRIFYALTGGGTPVNVADSFGLSFGPDDDYNYAVPVDLNGDGRSELLTRVSYSGSGVDRVLAFRWNAESSVSEEGRLFWDTETLFQHTGPLGERPAAGGV